MLASCVLVCTPPGYSGEGSIRPRREWAVAQVTKRSSGERDRLTGCNNIGQKRGSSWLLGPPRLAGRGRATTTPGDVLTASSAKE